MIMVTEIELILLSQEASSPAVHIVDVCDGVLTEVAHLLREGRKQLIQFLEAFQLHVDCFCQKVIGDVNCCGCC